MLKKILVVLAVFVLVLGFLVAKDWDSPELGRTLLDQVSASTGVSMTASGFRLNLLEGLELEGVEGSASSEGRDVTFRLDRLVFEHRLMPLLSGTVAVDRVVLDAPTIELVEGEETAAAETDAGAEAESEGDSGAPPSGEPAAAEGSGLALQVQQILVADGTLVMKKRGEAEEETRVEGLDFEMNDLAIAPGASSLAGISGTGELSVREVLFDSLKVSDTKAAFALADGRFELSELSFVTPQGRFRADMSVDFNPVPFTYRLAATGDPVDVNEVAGASGGFGPATVQLEAEGKGTASKDVTATGSVQLAAGQFPEDAMFAGVDQAVGKKVLAGSPYEATEATFRLENDRLTLDPFRFVSQDARLDLSGWASLEGPIALKLALATPREGVQIEGLGSNALDLLADDEGWVPVPLDVAGTLEEPRVRPDVRQLASQARGGAKREVTERATDALRGLFNKKKP